jgi:hypothetical protein
MKKIKLIMLSIAIAAGIGGAFAFTGKCQSCQFYDQYYLNNGSYVPAGTLGVTYICTSSSDICTYYKPYPSSPYLPCQTGSYLSLQ